MIVSEGDDIAADARVIEDQGLFVDQSMLTGEGAPVRKISRNGKKYHHPNRGHSDVLYAGTSVTAGEARALVVATGMNTRFGKIAHLTQSIVREQSPLQKEMERVTKTVSALAIAFGVAFFLIAVLILNVDSKDSFIFALGMIVAFVPEGMLPAVSLSLAIAVQQMSARNAVVRKLSSVETLGCTTVICSDKTGTLTRNEMTITKVWTCTGEFELNGNGYEPFGTVRGVSPNHQFDALTPVLEAGMRCCNARLIEPNEQCAKWTISGDPTEGAIVVAHKKTMCLVLANSDVPERPQNNTSDVRVDCVAFDPHRKRMSTLWKETRNFVSYVKGSPKDILDLSVSKLVHGQTVQLESSDRTEIVEAIDRFANDGLRVLAIARKSFEQRPEADEVQLEHDLVFLGLVAMADPLHAEVPDALRRCKNAGIRVIMITGDYELTARCIALQAGIVSTPNTRIVTGYELKQMAEADLEAVLGGEVIFARTSPEDKLRIVQTLQRLKHIVAVTGDGVNDAPALKQADIGIAMGLGGTDVARESADVILSDDNFASIVAAVELGRSVYDNIRKFALYVFTSNVAEAVPFAVLLFSRGMIPLPMTLMQVLLIDLGTDMLPAIGLGADPPDPNVMCKPPRDPKERLLSRNLLLKVFLWYGAIEACAAMSAYLFVNIIFGWPNCGFAPVGSDVYRAATTAAVCAVVACQIGTALCCRSATESVFKLSMTNNKLLAVGILFEVGLLYSVMALPPLMSVFDTRLPPMHAVAFTLLWLPVIVGLDEIRKIIIRARESKKLKSE
jgi:P-type Ca2+ transporter type 2C